MNPIKLMNLLNPIYLCSAFLLPFTSFVNAQDLDDLFIPLNDSNTAKAITASALDPATGQMRCGIRLTVGADLSVHPYTLEDIPYQVAFIPLAPHEDQNEPNRPNDQAEEEEGIRWDTGEKLGFTFKHPHTRRMMATNFPPDIVLGQDRPIQKTMFLPDAPAWPKLKKAFENHEAFEVRVTPLIYTRDAKGRAYPVSPLGIPVPRQREPIILTKNQYSRLQRIRNKPLDGK